MRAAERVFVDTNVLLYAADPADPAKRSAARQWLTGLWQNGAGRLSWQVLHEFYTNAVRKLRAHHAEARTTVELFATWYPIETSLGLIQRAWFWMDEARISYWDALIVAAAERAGCAWLLSEDFQTGRKMGAITVLNPFRSRPEEFGLAPK
jgi:predicted nucleic acid-binding protein